MHPILVSLGSFTIYSYGFMMSLAFLSGLLATLYLAKKEKIEPEIVMDVAIWVIVGAIVGARIFYVIQFWGDFNGDILRIFWIKGGGLVFYGGLILAVLMVIWRVRRHKLELWSALDLATPGTALGYSVARIGCFLNGCCYGVKTDFFCAVHFPHLQGLRHPTQMYASISIFAVFVILMMMWKRRKFSGQIFLSGVILYSVYRFLIEFIRVNPTYLFNLTSAQWLSVISFILALGTMVWLKKKN